MIEDAALDDYSISNAIHIINPYADAKEHDLHGAAPDPSSHETCQATMPRQCQL